MGIYQNFEVYILIPIGNMYILVLYQSLLFKYIYQLVIGRVGDISTCGEHYYKFYMKKINLRTRDKFKSFSCDINYNFGLL